MDRKRKTKERGVFPRDGTLYIDITTPYGRVKRSLRLEDTAKNRAFAQNILGEIRLKIARGDYRPEDYFPGSKRVDTAPCREITFREFVVQWLDGLDLLATSTWEGYRKIMNRYFLPALHDRPLTTITATELSSVIAGIAWQSTKTRNNALSPLKRLFDAAHFDGIIGADPTTRLRFAKTQKPQPDPLSLPEVERVLAWMERNPIYHNYFELAFFTGLRTSELIALKWGDIDWQRRTLTVQRAKVRRELKGTKTAVVREVELHSRALDALQRQKALTFLAGDWIFLHPATEKPFNDDKPPRLVWTSALKGSGLRHRDAYATRHTYITLALMSGANVLWVSRHGFLIKISLVRAWILRQQPSQ
jgi:integrase